MNFGERLKTARLNAGYTQEQLANKIGVAKSTLTGYEKGNREPDVFKIKALAAALNVTGDYLLGTGEALETQKTPAEIGEGDERQQKIERIMRTVEKFDLEQLEAFERLVDSILDFHNKK